MLAAGIAALLVATCLASATSVGRLVPELVPTPECRYGAWGGQFQVEDGCLSSAGWQCLLRFTLDPRLHARLSTVTGPVLMKPSVEAKKKKRAL